MKEAGFTGQASRAALAATLVAAAAGLVACDKGGEPRVATPTSVAQGTVSVIPGTPVVPQPASAAAPVVPMSVPVTGPQPTASLPEAGRVGPPPASAPDNQPPSVSPGSKT